MAKMTRKLIFAPYYRCALRMVEMKRTNEYEEQQRRRDRFNSTLAISALIIAAVQLAIRGTSVGRLYGSQE
jgi:hypothetical protein